MYPWSGKIGLKSLVSRSGSNNFSKNFSTLRDAADLWKNDRMFTKILPILGIVVYVNFWKPSGSRLLPYCVLWIWDSDSEWIHLGRGMCTPSALVLHWNRIKRIIRWHWSVIHIICFLNLKVKSRFGRNSLDSNFVMVLDRNSTMFKLWMFSKASKFNECFRCLIVECKFVEKSLL